MDATKPKSFDPIHTITNWISHNRYLFAALVAIVAVLVAACAPVTTVSPLTGEQVNADELTAQYMTESRDIQDRLDEIDRESAALAAEASSLVTRASDLDDDFDAAFDDIIERTEARNTAISSAIASLAGLDPSLAVVQSVFETVFPVASVLLAVGAGADNIRKDRIIKKQKESQG